MSDAASALLAAAKDAGREQLSTVLAASKKGFLDTFRTFVTPADLLELDAAFGLALSAKLAQFTAATTKAAGEAADEYEAALDVIETIADRYEIVGAAKLGVLARSLAHQVISGVAAVAGAVLQAGLAILFPGGGLVGAGLNAGLQHVVSYFLGE